MSVLEFVTAGLASTQVADALGVTRKDVEYHVSNLISKFYARNRAGVVGRAFVLGSLSSRHWPPRVESALRQIPRKPDR